MIPSQHTRWPPLAADIRSLRSDTRASAQPIIEFKIAVSPEASYIMPKASRPLPPEPSAHALCPVPLRVPHGVVGGVWPAIYVLNELISFCVTGPLTLSIVIEA